MTERCVKCLIQQEKSLKLLEQKLRLLSSINNQIIIQIKMTGEHIERELYSINESREYEGMPF